jgi:hypothetical protein
MAKSKLSISKQLGQVAKVSSKKSDKPVLDSMKSLVDSTVEMKKELEDLKNQYDQTEAQLLGEAYKVYDSVRDSAYASSILCEGSKSNGCMVIFQDKFSNLPIEMEDELRKLDPEYDEHFVESRKLSVKRTGKEIPDETIEKLMKALGKEFSEIFDVKQEIGTKSGLAEKFNELPKEVQERLSQAKGSVRLVTADGKVI